MAVSTTFEVDFSFLRDQRHKGARSAGDVVDWLAWLELGGIRPRTLRDYEWAVARMLRAYPQKNLLELTSSDIARVLRTFPPAGRRTKKAAYDAFFKWAYRTRRITINPMDDLPRIQREAQKVIELFSEAEIARLTSLPDNDGTLFLILFDTGIRRGEARNLQVRDVLLERAEIVIREGKGGKDRLIPIGSRLAQRLSEWFLLDALRHTDYLWPTRPGGYHLQRRKPMGETSFITWYSNCLDRAEIRYRNPHTTRHTFATNWLRKGGQLVTLSRILGHASIRTTADLYAHMDLTDVRRDLRLIQGDE